MGLDIGVLTHPTFVKPRDAASDEDWDNLILVHNLDAYRDRSDGRPEGMYAGDYHRLGGWSYGGYNRLRELIAEAAFGVMPEAIWQEPDGFTSHEHGDLVALINFPDNEGSFGPDTSAKLAAALERLTLPEDSEEAEYLREGVDRLRECFRLAASTGGFAVWA